MILRRTLKSFIPTRERRRRIQRKLCAGTNIYESKPSGSRRHDGSNELFYYMQFVGKMGHCSTPSRPAPKGVLRPEEEICIRTSASQDDECSVNHMKISPSTYLFSTLQAAPQNTQLVNSSKIKELNLQRLKMLLSEH